MYNIVSSCYRYPSFSVDSWHMIDLCAVNPPWTVQEVFGALQPKQTCTVSVYSSLSEHAEQSYI